MTEDMHDNYSKGTMNKALQVVLNPTVDDIRITEENALLAPYKIEEYDCLHMWLDDNAVPKSDKDNLTYSTIGRVKLLIQMRKEMRVGSDNICPITNQYCDDECCPPGAQCNIHDTDYLSPA